MGHFGPVHFPAVPQPLPNEGVNEIFHVGSRESLGELLRELWFSYCSSREMPFREWNFAFRESLSELLRECPGTLREFREWPSHSESVFPEIGVVLRLLTCALQCVRVESLWAQSIVVRRFDLFQHRSTNSRVVAEVEVLRRHRSNRSELERGSLGKVVS